MLGGSTKVRDNLAQDPAYRPTGSGFDDERQDVTAIE
jgi:hypothetical protein